MTPGLPFPSEEERSADVDDGRPLGDGFAVHSVGKRPRKSRVVGGSSSRRERFEGARVTADLSRETTEPDAATTAQVEALEARVARLSSVCEAMWQLMSTELGLDLGRLSAKLQEMGPSGTALEDREAAETVCPNCGNNKPPDQKLCLFCSARAPEDDTARL